MSAVGAGSRCEASSLSSLGISSSQFAIRMKKNSETASGATNGCTRPRLSSTWLLTSPTTALPDQLDLGRHVVACRLVSWTASPEAEDQHDRAGDEGGDDRVDVERHARATRAGRGGRSRWCCCCPRHSRRAQADQVGTSTLVILSSAPSAAGARSSPGRSAGRWPGRAAGRCRRARRARRRRPRRP